MIMLYKYMFYGYSYLVKKYDHLYDVGETYYVGGGMFIGLTIAGQLLIIYRIIGILYYRELLDMPYLYIFLPLVLGLAITIYLGVTKKHDKIYEEIKNLNPKKKRMYKVLNIIHIILTYGIFLALSDYIRYYVRGIM